MKDIYWWQGAIIYQVYPRSFMDSNNDGIGDLKGIENKLDYLADLGVDALWISPFFKSPMKDFGYDISDYRKVDPIFGSLDDFDQLLTAAHQRDLKIIIDQVLSHTSDQHPWFIQSILEPEGKTGDWYVWADGTPDSPPNNWLSVFGGSAWQWHEKRQQYYLHNFLASQPDLNYHNPELREAMLAEVRFWLDRGVDGFRFDAINYCYHDNQLRNNPIKPENERKARGFSKNNPYASQYHYFDNNRPEILPFLQDLRRLLDEYPEITSIGEINTEDSIQSIAEYTLNDRLHLGYSFELLSNENSPTHIRDTVENLDNKLSGGMGCWAISNHDVARVASRWASDGETSPERSLLYSIMAACLRGTLCVYQGEELGLTEAVIPREKLQDPYGIRFWPEFKGRDGCRTPMPWQANETHAGFTKATPWLPIAEEHLELAIDLQDKNKESTLNQYRQFLRWRKDVPTMRVGNISFLPLSNDNLLCFIRKGDNIENSVLCVFNFANKAVEIPLSDIAEISEASINTVNLTSVNGTVNLADRTIALPGYGIFLGSFT